ncbi:hypothetical protein chiPu_0021506 [Chiloscyllium punctatum]|uniref:Uncharacterized protein n=1 Tax=Chiloscyllium punctatum TaxID=137246 RepID=A0A401RGE0_CHIPU|nr:hypothetical protein [Chiloscyllium punctatum]
MRILERREEDRKELGDSRQTIGDCGQSPLTLGLEGRQRGAEPTIKTAPPRAQSLLSDISFTSRFSQDPGTVFPATDRECCREGIDQHKLPDETHHRDS